MKKREFIKGTMAAGITIAGGGLISSCNPRNAKGLATTVLGKTGVEVPRIALGLGSRWCALDDEDKALDILLQPTKTSKMVRSVKSGLAKF